MADISDDTFNLKTGGNNNALDVSDGAADADVDNLNLGDVNDEKLNHMDEESYGSGGDERPRENEHYAEKDNIKTILLTDHGDASHSDDEKVDDDHDDNTNDEVEFARNKNTETTEIPENHSPSVEIPPSTSVDSWDAEPNSIIHATNVSHDGDDTKLEPSTLAVSPSAAAAAAAAAAADFSDSITDDETVALKNRKSAVNPNKRLKYKYIEKYQRRVPGSLDLNYITTNIIGMAPPRAKFSEDLLLIPGGPDSSDRGGGNRSSLQKAIRRQSKKRQKGNDPGDLSSFLDKRHPRRYLLFNVSDEDADDRSLLLLGRQVVHLPWGSPKLPHFTHDNNHNDNNSSCSNNPGHDGRHSIEPSFKSTPSNNNSGNINKSSQTPAVSQVLEICYALHAYLSLEPCESPLELTSGGVSSRHHSSRKKSKREKKSSSGPPHTVACVYCGNGKTRTGVVVACYLRFCNYVHEALKGFELFCERRGIIPGIVGKDGAPGGHNNDMLDNIPPSLRQFFHNFDQAVSRKQYPFPEPLLLQSVDLHGVPVDDMPCIDIWEHGDVVRHQVYASHDDTSLNEWDDEDGSYKVGQVLSRDFTMVCRFGGQFAMDADDQTKVLFRYVNSIKFLSEGVLELTIDNVDMMKRYAESFDEEDFLLRFTFESVDDDAFSTPHRKKKYSSSSSLGNRVSGDHILDGEEAILRGWSVLSDAHLSHYSMLEMDDELMLDPTLRKRCSIGEVDFRYIALQLTNGDVSSAKAELIEGFLRPLLGNDTDKSIAYRQASTGSLASSPTFPSSQSTPDAGTEIEDEHDEDVNSSLEEMPINKTKSEKDPIYATTSDVESLEGGETSEQLEKRRKSKSLSDEFDKQSNGIHLEGNENMSLSNIAFLDHSHSSLLEAIKLRGLRNSISSMGNNDSRSSLLREISERGLRRSRSDSVQEIANTMSTFRLSRPGAPLKSGAQSSEGEWAAPGSLIVRSLSADGAIETAEGNSDDSIDDVEIPEGETVEQEKGTNDDIEASLSHATRIISFEEFLLETGENDEASESHPLQVKDNDRNPLNQEATRVDMIKNDFPNSTLHDDYQRDNPDNVQQNTPEHIETPTTATSSLAAALLRKPPDRPTNNGSILEPGGAGDIKFESHSVDIGPLSLDGVDRIQNEESFQTNLRKQDDAQPEPSRTSSLLAALNPNWMNDDTVFDVNIDCAANNEHSHHNGVDNEAVSRSKGITPSLEVGSSLRLEKSLYSESDKLLNSNHEEMSMIKAAVGSSLAAALLKKKHGIEGDESRDLLENSTYIVTKNEIQSDAIDINQFERIHQVERNVEDQNIEQHGRVSLELGRIEHDPNKEEKKERDHVEDINIYEGRTEKLSTTYAIGREDLLSGRSNILEPKDPEYQDFANKTFVDVKESGVIESHIPSTPVSISELLSAKAKVNPVERENSSQGKQHLDSAPFSKKLSFGEFNKYSIDRQYDESKEKEKNSAPLSKEKLFNARAQMEYVDQQLRENDSINKPSSSVDFFRHDGIKAFKDEEEIENENEPSTTIKYVKQDEKSHYTSKTSSQKSVDERRKLEQGTEVKHDDLHDDQEFMNEMTNNANTNKNNCCNPENENKPSAPVS
ncbi:hypothetical protein ACHAXS_004630, partial [Conticribra weissflogii]